jgi:egghead protein (zeste-white 4 protein)
VSFDHGIAGSIAEDAYFALKASNMGYTFDWIEGELYEEASFTFMDLVHQRKRWVQGLWLVHHSPNIKRDLSSFFFKLFHYTSLLLPLQFAGDIILTLFPVSFFKLDQILAHLNGLVLYYLLIVGLSYSFDLHKLSWIRRFCYIFSVVFVKRYWLFAESCAVVWAFLSNRDEFYVIKKQL